MLPLHVARRVRLLEIRTRKMMEGGFGGAYQSVFRGRGVEFDEVRAYVEGDDVRFIDWNVVARTGEPYVKMHVEERERTVFLVVDVSASVRFGSRAQRKQDLAAEVGCILAVAAAAAGDLTGLLLFSDRIEDYVPPLRGTRHALAIARRLYACTPSGDGTDIGSALEFLNRVLKRRAVVVLVSDFVGEGYSSALRVLGRRHDVIALRVIDPTERALPAAGLVYFRDVESGSEVAVDLSDAATRRLLADRMHDRERTLDRLLAQAGVDHVTLVAGEPYEASMNRLLSTRSRKRR